MKSRRAGFLRGAIADYDEIGSANKKDPVARFVQTCPAAWKPCSSGARTMNDDASLLFITPTYPWRWRMRFLQRCADDFRPVHNLFWIVIEDGDETSPEVGQLLAQSGVQHIYIAHGPTRRWGNAQRDWGLKYIRDQRLRGVVFLADDDNKYEAGLFDELRKVQRLGILPVGCLGPWGIERPIVRNGRSMRWSADWRDRKYPVDMAGFAFNSELLYEKIGDLWKWDGPGGETELVESLIDSPDELEFLCNDCRDCYVWHNLPVGWPAWMGVAAFLLRRRTPGFLRRKLYGVPGVANRLEERSP